jgi:hypothetical protein
VTVLELWKVRQQSRQVGKLGEKATVV